MRVQRGNLMQTSRVAKRAEVLNLVSLGIFNPVTDRDKILGYLEFGMVDDLYNEAEQDKKQAKKEQADWEEGRFERDLNKAVRDFYNHKVHIDEHNRWRKTKRYEALPPDLQEIIDMHVEAHRLRDEMAAMRAAGGSLPMASDSSASAGAPLPDGAEGEEQGQVGAEPPMGGEQDAGMQAGDMPQGMGETGGQGMARNPQMMQGTGEVPRL